MRESVYESHLLVFKDPGEQELNKKINIIITVFLSAVLLYGCSNNQNNKKEEGTQVTQVSEENVDNVDNSGYYDKELSFDAIEEVEHSNYSVHKETYNYSNDKSSSARISYPVVTINDNKELSDKINESIKQAAFYYYEEETVADNYNICIFIDYTIVYNSEDILSVFFSGGWIKGIVQRGISISLKDGSIITPDSIQIKDEDLLSLLKNKDIITTNPDLIKHLKEKNENIAEFFYDNYTYYKKYGFFIDESNIYLTITVAPVQGYFITLKVPYNV